MKKKYYKLSPLLKRSSWNIVKKENLSAFTLIELLVSITIFSMIMVSIMMIYVSATNISKKYDINREMRNNIKSVVEDIAEEVRKNDIVWVKSDYIWNYNFPINGGSWTRLKLSDSTEYILKKFKYNDLNNEDDHLNCNDVTTICTIYKKKNLTEIWPLSNSKISFTNLSFNITGSGAIPKLQLNFTARAAVRAGIKPELAKKTKIVFQTTLSSRELKVR